MRPGYSAAIPGRSEGASTEPAGERLEDPNPSLCLRIGTTSEPDGEKKISFCLHKDEKGRRTSSRRRLFTICSSWQLLNHFFLSLFRFLSTRRSKFRPSTSIELVIIPESLGSADVEEKFAAAADSAASDGFPVAAAILAGTDATAGRLRRNRREATRRS